MRSIPRAAALVLAAFPSAFIAAQAPAQPQPRPAERAAAEVVREKTVYVPYEKLEAVFEKEGRGIFLPYEEFLKLWEAAQPKPPEPKPEDPPAEAVARGGKYAGSVTGDAARFTMDLEIEALKKGWSELALPFSAVAVEAVELSSPRAIFRSKAPPAAGQQAGPAPAEYALYLPEPGRYTAKIQFSARVTQEPGRRTLRFGIPPTASSRLEVTIPEEDARVDVPSSLAVTQTRAAGKLTQVLAFLGNSSEVVLSWMPPAGKVADAGSVVFAEEIIRAHLGERILRVSTDVAYQVLRGEVGTLRVRVPEGTRLLSVKGDNIREWQEQAGVLEVRLHSAIAAALPPSAAATGAGAAYGLSLSFERILEATPPAVAVPFPRVEDVIRESGWVILGHEAGLNVRVASSQGLSQVDRAEVPEALRNEAGTAFRYLAQPLALGLEVEKLTPVIRAATTSVVTLGREEDVWVGWIDYAITRAGVFRLEVRVPSRWSVGSVGDPGAVEDYQTSDADGARTIAVSLKSKAIGAFRLPFRLTAPGSAATGEATHGPPLVAGAIEDRGLFGVSAPRAIDLGTLERQKLISTDVDELFRSGIMAQVGADAGIPLAYSFREQPASVKLRLEAKKTEIDLLAQHLLEIGDGGIKLTHILDFEVLYAATDRLTFTAPTSLDNLLKVEAKEKKEVRRAGTTQDRTSWEVLLQAPALGAVTITLTHEVELKGLESGKPFAYLVPLVHSADVRAEKGFIAIRKEGTLEIAPQPSGLEAIEAGDLPDKLRRGGIYGAFRYFTQGPALTLTLTRYEYQPLATTIVSLLRAQSVLSEEKKLKTKTTLFIQNTERQYLELGLPPERIISLSVAGKAQQPRKRKDGAGTLVQIPASAGSSGTFPIVVVHEEALGAAAMGVAGGAGFRTIEVLDGVPVSKVEVELFLPPDYAYLLWRGSLRQIEAGTPTLWSRFKALVNEAAGARPAPLAQASQPPPAPAPAAPEIELPTRGLIPHSFETLAPVGSLRFAYVGRSLFSIADFIAFIAALAGGWLVLRAPWRLAAKVAALLLLPLALTWFASGPILEVFASLAAGGILVLVAAAVAALMRAVRERQAYRLALAPDPFLEDAAKRPAEKKVPPSAAPPPVPPAGTAEGK